MRCWWWMILVLIGCGRDRIEGRATKGPMIEGSSVDVAKTNNELEPTGSVYQTETLNDAGEFAVRVSGSGPFAVTVDGFFWHEAFGEVSQAPMTVRGFMGGDEVRSGVGNINLVTHLTHNRVRTLVEDGLDYDQAVARAEEDLIATLEIGPPELELDRATQMDILGGASEESAYLYALSSIIAMSGGASEIQELANAIAVDIAPDGTIEREPVREKLLEGERSIDSHLLEGLLEARISQLGMSVAVPDLDTMLDQDRDRVVNSDDNCPWYANSDQMDADTDGTGDICAIRGLTDLAGGYRRVCAVDGQARRLCWRVPIHPWARDMLADGDYGVSVSWAEVHPGDHAAVFDSGAAIECWADGSGVVSCGGDEPAHALWVGLSYFAGDNDITAVSSAEQVTCALTAEAAFCARSDGTDQVQVYDLGTTWTIVANTHQAACGAPSVGTAACSSLDPTGWSEGTQVNVDGVQVTVMTNPQGETEQPPPGPFTTIVSGEDHFCALKSDQTIVCWGEDDHGETTPPSASFVELAAAGDATCAIDTSQRARCWGDDNPGIPDTGLPTDEFSQSLADTPDEPLSHLALATTGDRYVACAISADQQLVCWGRAFLDWEDY